MNAKSQKRRLLLLEALRGHTEPVSSAELASELARHGMDVSERTVRTDLAEMAEDGEVETLGRRGHRISQRGLEELRHSNTVQRVGLLSAKIDAMTFGMDFDLERRTGTVVVNMTVCDRGQLERAIGEISAVFAHGYAMGSLVSLVPPGGRIGESEVPPGKVGFCTVCSITLNGILLKHGVPTRSRFGGLLELRDARPVRFAEAIDYNGTTLDPLVIFIRGGFTNYRSAIRNGCGLIGASFREVPAGAHDLVQELALKSQAVGLGGFLEIAPPGCDLLGVPGSAGCCGAVVIGGLNPVSIMEERGDHVMASALSGFLEYNRLFPYTQLPERLNALRT